MPLVPAEAVGIRDTTHGAITGRNRSDRFSVEVEGGQERERLQWPRNLISRSVFTGSCAHNRGCLGVVNAKQRLSI